MPAGESRLTASAQAPRVRPSDAGYERGELTLAAAATNIRDMSLPPDQRPPAKPKITPEERRRRTADRLTMIRLKMAISRELDDRDVSTPTEIGAALGMPAAEAVKPAGTSR